MATEGAEVTFAHPHYRLEDGDRVVRLPTAPPVAEESRMAEQTALLEALVAYVQESLTQQFGFQEVWIPSDDEEEVAKCSILVTPDWASCERLLVVVQNAVGSQLGVWSRSLCLESGLNRGSMLPCIAQARRQGFGIVILRPNANSIVVRNPETGGQKKIPIDGSSSPEEHTLYVWDNIIADSQCSEICILSYGNGAILAKDILQRQFVRSRSSSERNRLTAIATIEASVILEEDDAEDVRDFLAKRALNWESSRAPVAYQLTDRSARLGVMCLSAGSLPDEQPNVAYTVGAAMDSVFRFLGAATSGEHAGSPNLSELFARMEARNAGHDPASATGTAADPASATRPTRQTSSQDAGGKKGNIFSRLFGGGGSGGDAAADGPASPTGAANGGTGAGGRAGGAAGGASGAGAGNDFDSNDFALGSSGESRLSVQDFDLLKVVGKGAFGKVMLVRKKGGVNAGQIFAMKVLKKSVIVQKGQVEHTKSERSILMEIRHPFVVRLRFAFQNEEKLYLVTDYYNGGSLFYHLRKSRMFSEERARFYAAELLTALDHLHQQHIIYRDLKLENVLMDHNGHIALTDFGLSKQNIDMTGGATTFCGTAEYIAPELLRGQKYGPEVDWWSFGILVYEMMAGRTPFYDKNRKLMFYKIVNTAPQFPPHFSEEACESIRLILNTNPAERIGSSEAGAEEIMGTPFFATIDFDALLRKELEAPFRPDVHNEFDTRYVPKAYLNAEAKDSEDLSSKAGAEKPQFDGFTFAGEKQLDAGEDDG